MFNSNAIHNAINIIIAVVGLAAPILVATGCTHDPILDKFDCSASYIPPLWIGPILGALGVLKLVMNMGRDGFGGLIKVQPPVADAVTTVVQPVVVSKDAAAKAPEVTVKTNFNK